MRRFSDSERAVVPVQSLLPKVGREFSQFEDGSDFRPLGVRQPWVVGIAFSKQEAERRFGVQPGAY
jgi:hypothetical protein